MSRYARIHVTGGLFHIISRFHDRRFYLDLDGARGKYLDFLGKAAKKHDARIIAYCLMSSHVHLVVQLGTMPIGGLTRSVHSPFGNWVNSSRRGLGSIMAGRPISVLVHSETYGMELIRYVHNNPVRAGVVERASDSDWSSHRAYLGLAPFPPWLATEAVFDSDRTAHESIRHEYAHYVDEGRREGHRPEFSGKVSPKTARRVRKLVGGDVEPSYPVLGPDDFVVAALKEQVQRQRDRQTFDVEMIDVDQVVKRVFGALGLEPGLARMRIRPLTVARGRALVAWLCVERMGYPQVKVASYLGVKSAAVTKMLAKLRQEGTTPSEEKILEKVWGTLVNDTGGNTKKSIKDNSPMSSHEPRVIILKRPR